MVGCANIIPPAGGDRDSLPPLLLKATPKDSTKNFSGNTVTLTFDEFVDVQNAQQNLNVSPTQASIPNVTWKLRTITVKLRDTLEPNTTYTLDFGDAIKDINEGNIFKNFTYVFSTGNSIDSLEVRGKVILAETGKPDSTLVAILHKSPEDSALTKQRPRYVTKLDSSGNFVFRNLPPGTFYLYALKDGTRLMATNQLFAFADQPVTSQLNATGTTMYAYPENRSVKPVSSSTPKKPGSAQERRLKLTTNVGGGPHDLLGNVVLTSEVPIRSLDSARIRLASDTLYVPVTNFKVESDTSKKVVQIIYPWKENTLYHVILDKDFAEDTLGRKLLKSDTFSFKTHKLSDYGTIKMRIRNLDMSKNPVLLFVQNEAIVKSFPLTSVDFYQQLFLPGDYQMRILFDINKNGKWDPGDFFGKHKQPEIVTTINRPAIIRANFVNEFEIQL